MTRARPSICIVSPALANANNGNWRTAARWRAILAPDHEVRIVRDWPDGPRAGRDAVMLALHARRSAASIEAWSRRHPGQGLAVVLTGTDLYDDLVEDASARRSIGFAQRLVVLHELGVAALPAALRDRARVILQSTTPRAPQARTRRHLRALMVGHLREVKRPDTLFEAARLLRDEPGILIDHVGEALDPQWARRARRTEAACPNYRWLGPLPHEAARRRIQRAHLLVHASRAEGGAHVIMEAVCAATPVLASRVDGNVGMLGTDYAGYFRLGDAAALAGLLRRCRDDLRGDSPRAGGNLLETLARQCRARAALFSPPRERAELRRLIDELARSSG